MNLHKNSQKKKNRKKKNWQKRDLKQKIRSNHNVMRALSRTNEPTSDRKAKTNLNQHKTIDNHLYGLAWRAVRQSRADKAVNAMHSNDDNLFSASLYRHTVKSSIFVSIPNPYGYMLLV